MDDSGAGLTSDVIKGAEWILANKDKYNIRVANFSLHSANIEPLLRRSAQPGDQQAVVRRRRRRGCGRELRQARRAERGSALARQQPVRDHRGCRRHRRHAAAQGRQAGRRGRRTAARLTGSGSRRSALRAATWSGRCPRTRRFLAAKAENRKSAQATSSSPARRSRRRSSRVWRRSSWPGIPSATPDQVKGALMASANGRARRRRRTPCGVGRGQRRQSGLRKACIQPERGAEPVRGARGGRKRPRRSTRSPGATCPGRNVSWSNVSWSNVSWSEVSWDAVSWSNVSWSNVSWSNVSWSNSSSEDSADGETPGSASTS